MLKIEAAARLVADKNWFEELPQPQQETYVEEHPNSKYAKDVKDAELTDKAPKTKPVEDKVGTEQPSKQPRQPAPILWTMHTGDKPTAEQSTRLKSLRVPPAWTNIKLADDPNAALQVVGKDAKGRAQYLYSAEHSAKAAAEKFARLKEFNTVAAGIAEKSNSDMNNKKLAPKARDSAAVIQLISKTGFRIGSDDDTGADVKAHGATTLEGSHVKVKGDTMTFDFIGKKGVNIKKTLVDANLAKYIQAKKRQNGDGKLFDTDDASVRDYFHASGGKDFKVKDFRTWNATNLALEEMQKPPVPKDEKEFKAKQKQVATVVSQHLGNTPKVAMESYIDPAVWDYKNGQ